MNETQSFREYLQQELKRYAGIIYPIYALPVERLLIRKLPYRKLHPNPDDEFCMKTIGPNEEIISKYREIIKKAIRDDLPKCFDEPLIVEKARPDGYMILNGHHRWAAAIMMDERRIPVEIVNLTRGIDIKRILQHTRNSKRVSMDFDEVILIDPDSRNPLCEENLRIGVPALFHFLKSRDYDIWLYTARYYSMKDIKRFFRRLSVRVDGIVTGMVSHRPGIGAVRSALDSGAVSVYPRSVHIDSRSVLCIDRSRKKFMEHDLSGAAETWSQEIMDYIKVYEQNA